MRPRRTLFLIMALLVVAGLMAAALMARSASESAPAGLTARLRPLHQWRVGYHRVNVCQSPNPMMEGWNVNLGPLSISRLSRWQPGLMIATNALIVTNPPAAPAPGGL